MGLLPIGFFSPLPLAMMIPFMATQSLAMGEAFGKSFQYGKRKISSMTNEDFNKYTFEDMMTEQTANIKMIVPTLSAQMADSFQLQVHIFDEMIKLIPAFFESLVKAFNSKDLDLGFHELPGGINIPVPDPQLATYQATNQPDPQLISNFPERKTISEIEETLTRTQMLAMGTEQLQYKIDNVLKGTMKSVAQGIINDRLDKGKAEQTLKQQAASAPSITNAQTEFNIWVDTVLAPAQQAWLKAKTESVSIHQANKQYWLKQVKITLAALRTISNDYRNPNNHIRNMVLQLRQELRTTAYA